MVHKRQTASHSIFLRDQQIYADFRAGADYIQLHYRYNVSIRHLYRILKSMEELHKQGQLGL